jgi:hypothetical protein
MTYGTVNQGSKNGKQLKSIEASSCKIDFEDLVIPIDEKSTVESSLGKDQSWVVAWACSGFEAVMAILAIILIYSLASY